MNLLVNRINQLLSEEADRNIWIDSPYKGLKMLSIDAVGKVGELVVWDLVKDVNYFNAEYLGDENTDPDDGIYDIKINNTRIEIKTATQNTDRSGWQHEGLYFDYSMCDLNLLFDVSPDIVYITMVKHFDATKRHPLLGRKPTLRADKNNSYKFDLGNPGLRASLEFGSTIAVDFNNLNLNKIQSFLENYV